jgi:hypothetical protein
MVKRLSHECDYVFVAADRVACKLPDVTSGILSSLSPYLYSSIIQYCLVAVGKFQSRLAAIQCIPFCCHAFRADVFAIELSQNCRACSSGDEAA